MKNRKRTTIEKMLVKKIDGITKWLTKVEKTLSKEKTAIIDERI